jgi:hypothetical protein
MTPSVMIKIANIKKNGVHHDLNPVDARPTELKENRSYC